MKIGLFHSVQWPEGSSQADRYRESLEQACFAEEVGFDSVWMTEHHFSRHGIASDSLTVLSHLAARPSTIRLGTAVSVLPLHNPLRLLEAAATVDLLSGGRLDLGIGRGYQSTEFDGFGVAMADKGALFDEAVDILKKAWGTDAAFSHEGPRYTYHNAYPQPRPIQTPHPPLWVATDSPDGLAACVSNDWGVLLPQGTSFDVVGQQVDRYRTALSDRHKSLDEGRVWVARAAYVAATDAKAWEEAEPPYRSFLNLADKLRVGKNGSAPVSRSPFDMDKDLSENVLFGSPESVVAGLRRLHDLGVDRVMLFLHMADLPHDKIMGAMELLGKEVIPAVAEF